MNFMSAFGKMGDGCVRVGIRIWILNSKSIGNCCCLLSGYIALYFVLALCFPVLPTQPTAKMETGADFDLNPRRASAESAFTMHLVTAGLCLPIIPKRAKNAPKKARYLKMHVQHSNPDVRGKKWRKA